MTDPGLASAPLFGGCDPAAVGELAARLQPRSLDPGEQLLTAGEEGRFFALVATGEVVISRETARGPERLAVAGPGSLIGELALLRRRPRMATATAAAPTVALTGGADVFESLLGLPGVHDRIRRLVSARLAGDVLPVHAVLRDGTPVVLRPLLPSDRQGLVAAIRQLSAESLRRRFFTAGQPSSRIIDYLVEIDYVDHFAWLVLDAGHAEEGLATARYIRHRDAPERAEIAFAVKDEHQGRGIGSLLLGAIGAAASVTGIRELTGSLLSDNAPMRVVLAKAAASFAREEPGVTAALLTTDGAAALLPAELRRELEAAARDIVTAAGLALAHSPERPR